MGADSVMGRIVGILDVDSTKFSAGIAKAKGQFSATASEIDGKGGAIRGVLGGIGSAMIAVGAISFLKGAISEAIEDEAALVRLKTAVRATGQEWGTYASQMDSAAKAGVQLGFTDDNTTAALAKLTLMTGDASKALGDLGLAQDLARGTGMDLEAASGLVAKVEEGRIGIAARMLPFLTATMTKEEAIAALREHTAGQAAAFANTAAGAQARWTASLALFQAEVGSRLLPTLSGLLNAVSGIIDGFSSLDPAMRTAIINSILGAAALTGLVMATNAASAGFVTLGMSEAAAAAPLLALIAVAAAFQAIMAMVSAKVGVAIGDFAGLGGVQDTVVQKILSAIPVMRGYYELILGTDRVARIMGDTTGKLADEQSNLASATSAVTEAFKAEKFELAYDKGAQENYLQSLIDVKAKQQDLANAINNSGAASAEARLAALELEKAEGQLSVASGQVAGTVTALGGSANTAAGKIGWLADAVRKMPGSKSVHVSVDVSRSAFDRLLADIKNPAMGRIIGAWRPPGQAAGGIISAAPGGVPVTVSENGYPETLINWSPANASRNADLLSKTAAGLGMSTGGGGGGGNVFNITGSREDGNAIARIVESVLSGTTRSASARRLGGATA